MASVFWDGKGIVDYLQKDINGEYYANLLRQLQKAMPRKISERVLFHQDNAPAHKTLVSMAAMRNCGFELVDDPPDSPDLAPSDYHLFPNMKKYFAGNQYHSDDERFFISGIQALQLRWKKCVDCKGGLLKNKSHLVKTYESILVNLSTNLHTCKTMSET